MSSLAKALSVAILMGTAGQAAAVDNGGPIDRALSAIRANPVATRWSTYDGFATRGVTIDRNGTEHVRFARSYKGLPVIGGDLVVHSRAGTFKSASLMQAAPLNLATTPTITADKAITNAGAQFGTSFDSVPSARLVVFARKTPTLAYDVLYTGSAKDGTPIRMHYYVNATSGAIITKEDAVQTGTPPGTGYGTGNPPADPVLTPAIGTGRSLYAGVVPIDTAWNATRRYYEMKDPTRGNTNITDMGNGFRGGGGLLGLGTLMVDGDNKWGSGANTDRASAAVDAAYGFAKTWDFYKNEFGRLGIAGDGKGATGAVHYLTSYNNAFWSNDCFCMAFGDGDGKKTRAFVAIDVMGHEMTHGVTAATAGLIYQGESGGLNEATSDILGTMVEHFANNPSQPPNYLIGEALFLPVAGNPPALRYMFKPSIDTISDDCFPDGSDPTYLEFFTGTGTYAGGGKDPHYTSGVANHFFYLLAEGAVVPTGFGAGSQWNLTPNDLVCNGNVSLAGVGREAATQIWYRALTVYMTSATTYANARAATMSAAADLYGVGSAQQNAVAATWDAVRVH
ncbi:M4 family metallopeptidase [Lysobacter sp. KIS68-7]|uniref:M4 family metallopeptidase n=1 Tax=Lysobacter sp. KIS68-7 TaxID=2904252 RepID=UPI001E3FBEF6|nr:M4 family metallopeptidase [Lysobacter sp. KIS68-7]UHQ19092.1 M4 family metallopeptidase [Lysobacter sp. KIS68-7]